MVLARMFSPRLLQPGRPDFQSVRAAREPHSVSRALWRGRRQRHHPLRVLGKGAAAAPRVCGGPACRGRCCSAGRFSLSLLGEERAHQFRECRLRKRAGGVGVSWLEAARCFMCLVVAFVRVPPSPSQPTPSLPSGLPLRKPEGGSFAKALAYIAAYAFLRRVIGVERARVTVTLAHVAVVLSKEASEALGSYADRKDRGSSCSPAKRTVPDPAALIGTAAVKGAEAALRGVQLLM